MVGSEVVGAVDGMVALVGLVVVGAVVVAGVLSEAGGNNIMLYIKYINLVGSSYQYLSDGVIH